MARLAFVGTATLSSFFKDVYRRRIWLLIMVLALMGSGSGGGVAKTTSDSAMGSSAQKQHDYGTRRDGRPAISKMLWNVDTLAVVVVLHVFWSVRLAAMLMEDDIAEWALEKGSSPGSSAWRGSAHLPALVALAAAASAAAFTPWAGYILAWLGVPHHARLSADAVRATNFIKLSELSVSLASLVGPLCKLPHPLVRKVIPRQVSLPSPSHAFRLSDWVGFISPGSSDAANGSRNRAMRNRGIFRNLDNRRSAEQTLLAAPQPAEAGPGHGPGPYQPLRYTGSDGKRAPRQRGVRVQVDTSWLLEHLITLYGHAIGTLNLGIIVLSLPGLLPLFPVLLMESAVVESTWSKLRQAIECLEFVRRRFGSKTQMLRFRHEAALGRGTGDARNDDDVEEEEQMCAICFEAVILPSVGDTTPSGTSSGNQDVFEEKDTCILDCKHQLHAICLVQWLAKQTFCPCCHAKLYAMPPELRARMQATT